MNDPRPLLRWNHDTRLRFSKFFETLPWDVLSENHETSHQSIASVFMHGTNMEDWWLHYVLPGKVWDGPAYDGFTSPKAMRERVEHVNARTEKFVSGLREADLDTLHDLSKAGYGGTRATSLRDLLTEIVTEDTHHRGEILAMLWRKDIEPPTVSFLTWAASR